jgi:integrase
MSQTLVAKVRPMTAKECEALAKREGFHAISDTPGLYLRVNGAARTFVLRAMHKGIRRDTALGVFGVMMLEQARLAARQARARVKAGLPPIEPAAPVATVEASPALTFAQAVDDYCDERLNGYRNAKHRQQWENTLKSYAVPLIGSLPAVDVKRRDVIRVLKQPYGDDKAPLWLAIPETANRLRGRIEHVLAYAAAVEERESYENPAELTKSLKALLPSRESKAEAHFPALAYKNAPAFMMALNDREGQSAHLLRFIALTAVRFGEAAGAAWDEIDLEKALWHIPASRMKIKTKPHEVPLSRQALVLLRGQQAMRVSGDERVFPSRSGGRLSDMALTALLRRLPFMAAPPYQDRKPTTHGLRSTFKDWSRENTQTPSDVVELCLAHKNPDAVERAYGRSNLLELRRAHMQAWADFIAPERA